MHISFLEEAGNTLSYRHSIFHSINRPQRGCGMKYFMRLGVIGFGYRGEKAKKLSSNLSGQASCHGNLRRRSDTRTFFWMPA